jgi:hypothetical protein
VSVWDGWNWFRNGRVGVVTVVGVKNVELSCRANRALGRTQQCRENSKDIEKKMCSQ